MTRKSSRGRIRELVREEADDLRRPEELVLDVDEPLSAADRAAVRLEHGEVAARQVPVVDALRDRAHELHVVRAGGVLHDGCGKLLAGRAVPAQAEVLGDVGDDRTLQARREVVPADPAARLVLGAVPRVAAVEGQVDAADEADAVVDDDRLLVVAVPEAHAAVEGALDLRAAAEPVDHLADVSPRRAEDAHGRAIPDEHAHRDPLRDLGEEVPDGHGILVPRQRELRGEEPAGYVDVRLRRGDLLGREREELRAVDEHLDRRFPCAAAYRRRPSRRLGCRGHGPSRPCAAGARGDPRPRGRLRCRRHVLRRGRVRGGRRAPVRARGPGQPLSANASRAAIRGEATIAIPHTSTSAKSTLLQRRGDSMSSETNPQVTTA